MPKQHHRDLLLLPVLLILNSIIVTASFSLVQTALTRKNLSVRMSDSSISNSMHFGKFIIPPPHIFYFSKLSAAFVNLRPIVQGHVLVIPERVTPYLADLTDDEYHDLWSSVRVVQQILKRHYVSTTAFNVAVQDGRAAGQSVPHVHVHILPRFEKDLERIDEIYDRLEEWAPRPELAANKNTNSKLDVPDDSERKDRTTEQMAEEAAIYRKLVP